MTIAWHRAIAELKAEAARGYLGFFWWVLEPLLLMSVFYLIFASGIRGGSSNFVYFLLCGLIPWKWFASAVQTGSGAIVGNAAMIRQVYFPKYMLVLALVLAASLKFVLVLALLVILLAASGTLELGSLPLLIPLLAIQFLLVFGAALIAASLTALIPDLKLIIDNGVLLLFFLSGIFFDVTTLATEDPWWFTYNPIAQLLQGYRAALLGTPAFPWSALLVPALFALVLGLSGLALTHYFDRKFAKFVV